MGRGCWLLIALISCLVAVTMCIMPISAASDDTASQEAFNTSLVVGGCLGLLFASFSLYSLGMISKIGKERKKDQREEAMLNEMQMLRQQVSTPAKSEDDLQIDLASRFWKEGKKAAAIEILESMPFNDRAQAILNKIKSG